MKKLFTLLALCFGLLSAYAQEGVTYTLKTLTFEDADYVSDSTNYLGHRNWSSLIDIHSMEEHCSMVRIMVILRNHTPALITNGMTGTIPFSIQNFL